MRRILAALLLLAGLTAAAAQVPPPVPALPDTQRLTTYSISSSTCICSVGFSLYGDGTDYQNWLQVFVNGVSYAYNDPTFGWTITSPTGALGSIPLPITDAVLTFNQSVTGTVNIVGTRRPRRLSQFTEGRGIAARDANVAVTDVVAENREEWDWLNRAVVGQPGEVLTPLVAAASRAGKLLLFDGNGNPSVVAPGTPAVAGTIQLGATVMSLGQSYSTISGPLTIAGQLSITTGPLLVPDELISAIGLAGTMVTNPGNNGFFGLLIKVVTAKNNAVESAFTVDMNATQSCPLSFPSGGCNKIALYTGIICANGNSACWASNPLITIGSPSSNFQSGIGMEIDFNNQATTNYGTYTGQWNNTSTGAGCPGSAGGGGTYNCYTVGLIITGGGAGASGGTLDVGATVTGTGPAAFNNALWNRGFVAGPGIYQHAFEDASGAQVSLAIYGSHTYGIDMNGSGFTGQAIRLPSLSVIGGRNAGNTADVNFINWNAPNLTLQSDSGGFVFIPSTIKTNQTVANGTVATAMSSLGPALAHTTIQEWLQVTDNSGNIRYIPMF